MTDFKKHKKLLTRREAYLATGIPERTLKHMVTDKYQYIKPPHKKIGKTTFYGPLHQLMAWFDQDLSKSTKQNSKSKENTDNTLDISDKKIKVIK